VESNEKWGVEVGIADISVVKRRMWTAYWKKWESTDPLHSMALRPLAISTADKAPHYYKLLAMALC